MKSQYLTGLEPRPARQQAFKGSVSNRRPAEASVVDRRPERQAKTLSDRQVERLLEHVRTNSSVPFSDELKVLLSFYAGLRVGEIATLPVSALCDAEGKIGSAIVIYANNAKNGQARRIPMHPRIREGRSSLSSRVSGRTVRRDLLAVQDAEPVPKHARVLVSRNLPVGWF